MKVPVPCLRCHTYSMEMDMAQDHQHIKCQNCEATWCLRCQDITPDPLWLAEQQKMNKAELN